MQERRIGITLHPCLDRNLHRRASDAEQLRVTCNDVPDIYRAQERHSVDGHGGYPAMSGSPSENGSAEIHLRHQPTPKDIAIGVRVGRHRNGPNHDLAMWLGWYDGRDGHSLVANVGEGAGASSGCCSNREFDPKGQVYPVQISEHASSLRKAGLGANGPKGQVAENGPSLSGDKGQAI